VDVAEAFPEEGGERHVNFVVHISEKGAIDVNCQSDAATVMMVRIEFADAVVE
jgi:hypothetical protein